MPGGTDESPDWCKQCELRWRSRHMLEAGVSSSHILSWHFAWTPALQNISSHCNLMTEGWKRVWCQSHEQLNGDVVIMSQWDACIRYADICCTMIRGLWPLPLQFYQHLIWEQMRSTKLFMVLPHKSFTSSNDLLAKIDDWLDTIFGAVHMQLTHHRQRLETRSSFPVTINETVFKNRALS